MAYSSLQKVLVQQLADIRSNGLYKQERQLLGPQDSEIRVTRGTVLNLCANNYLGLANHPEIRQAAIEGLGRYGYGMASVRFICGTQDLHKRLEQQISSFLGTQDAGGMAVVDHHDGVVAVGEVDDAVQLRYVPIHREDAIRGNQP